MTEDEAKTKWCPMVRLAGGVDWTGSSNRVPQSGITGTEYPLYKCIASGCMMWKQTIDDIGFCGLSGEDK